MVMRIAKVLGILSFAAFAAGASGCVSTYDAGVQTAVTRPTYGPAKPTKPRATPYNPAPKPKPDPKNHAYSVKPNPNSTAYNYYPGTQHHVTSQTVKPVSTQKQPATNNAVNGNAVYTAPVLNNTAKPATTETMRPSNTSTTVSRPSNTSTAVSRPSDNTVTVSKPDMPCQTDADCAANDRCVRTGNTGHCVRQK